MQVCRKLLALVVVQSVLHAADPFPAVAQDDIPPLLGYLHRAWGAADGLPRGALEHVDRSSDGYLWLGSIEGTRRFDGIRIVPVEELNAGDASDVTRDIERPLLRDRRGDLWFCTKANDLVRYRDGRFTVIPGPPNGVRRMAEDGAGRLWLVTGNDVLFELRDGRVVVPDLPPAAPQQRVLGVVADRDSGLWIGTRNSGLHHVIGDTVRHYPAPFGPPDLRPLLHASDGSLWVFGDGLLQLRDGQWTELRTPGGARIVPPHAIEYPAGTVWIATRGMGLLRWREGRFTRFGAAEGLTSNSLEFVLADEEGSIWAATATGLDQLRPARFIALGTGEDGRFASPTSIVADRGGQIWVTIAPGFALYRVSGDPIDGSGAPLRWSRIESPPGRMYSLLAAARRGGVWVRVRQEDRLYRITATGTFAGPRHGVPNDGWIPRLLEDPRGGLWIAPSGGGLRRVTSAGIEPQPMFATDAIGSLIEDSTGRIWVSSSTRALVGAWRAGRWERWDESTGLSERIAKLSAGQGDTVWGISATGKVLRFAGGRLTIQRDEGLAGIAIGQGSALAVARGELWYTNSLVVAHVSIGSVLHAMDAPMGQIIGMPWQLIGPEDGVAVPRAARLSNMPLTVGPDGRIWLASAGGVVASAPEPTPINAVPPRVMIEDVTVGTRPIASAPWSERDLALPELPDRVALRFTATSLRDPSRVRVQYRLDGVDRDWVAATADRMASYAQLGPGRYVFRVRAWNDARVPSVEEARLSFRVPPAWYQSWLVRSAALLVLAAMCVLLVRRRQHAQIVLAEERARLRYAAMLEERTRVAGELHDTVLQTFAGVALQLGAVREIIPSAPDRALRTLSDAVSLLTTALREARDAIWDLRVPELASRDLPSAIAAAARDVVGERPIAVDLHVEGLARDLPLAVEGAVVRVAREAMTNAVRHAGARRITVRLREEGAALALDVTDDGCGIDSAAAARAVAEGHWGLRGMQERAARHGGTLTVAVAPEGGTSVQLRVPLRR